MEKPLSTMHKTLLNDVKLHIDSVENQEKELPFLVGVVQLLEK